MKIIEIVNQRQTKLALSIAAALSVSVPLYAADFEVTEATDNGNSKTQNTLSWAIKQANISPDEDTITLKTDVILDDMMKSMINSDLTVIGNNKTIDGNHKYRPFFIKSGTVKLVDMTITQANAKGGDSQKGGGGAGLGGALFVYAGNVTVENVTFINNQAIGGNSGTNTLGNGGGGMGGNAAGHGGGGLFEASFHRNGGYGGNGNYGNSDNENFGVGGFAGGGGGGFGGGGGGLSLGGAGGAGGFGGGGGGGGVGGVGGNGGFGGGGGVGGMGGVGALGGFGGGNTGGGGAGFGGAIFIKAGHLTLKNSLFKQNLAQGGIGTNHGQAKAGAIFVCTNDLHATASSCDATVTTSQVVFCDNSATDALAKEHDTVNYFGDIGNGHRLCGPEIEVVGKEQGIDDGDDTPSTLDGTDFGIVNVGSSTTHTFTLKNTGELALQLLDSPSIKVSANSFSVTLQPTSPVDAMTGTTSFELQFAPTESGLVADVVTIVNNDHDENPYNFSIKAIGNNTTPTVKAVTFQIAENAPPKEIIGIVSSGDAESNIKTTGGYAIVDGNTDNVFSINDNGEITLANANLLKGGDTYRLIIQATDLGELSNKNTVIIEVTASTKKEADLESDENSESENLLENGETSESTEVNETSEESGDSGKTSEESGDSNETSDERGDSNETSEESGDSGETSDESSDSSETSEESSDSSETSEESSDSSETSKESGDSNETSDESSDSGETSDESSDSNETSEESDDAKG